MPLLGNFTSQLFTAIAKVARAITGNGTLEFTLNNPNASFSDVFGSSVAVSGNYAIVGAYAEDGGGGTDSGKAYIFNVTTGALVHTLNDPNAYGTSASDYFGSSVAISGNYAIVGAYQEDDAGGTQSGKAYIFDVTAGALLFTLNNPNAYGTSAGDNFGRSVSISGDYAIVGAVGEDDAGVFASGKAYIYNVTTGALVHTLNDPNAYSTNANDNFGWAVAISGNYAIVGADQEDDAGGSNSGKAYIFNVTTGALLFTLNNPNAYNTSASDYFGSSVAISGDYAIVGASLEDEVGGSDSGKAYIYNVTTGVLIRILNNPNAYGTNANDNFGWAVAISGNYAIVSAYQEGDAGGSNSGKSYVFNVTTGALVYTLNNPNVYGGSVDDNFGVSVAMSGNYAIVGASGEDDASGTDSGKAYIYNVTTRALLHTLNNPNAYGTSASDQFGKSVAISGNYAIVGAPDEDDAGGTSSGKAYIYNVTTGALLHTLNNPNPDGAGLFDRFGTSVTISGNYAIVGSYYERETAGGAQISGKAYIYNVTTGALLFTLNNPNAYGTSASDYFGVSVAVSGDYAIVGADQEDDAGGSNSGKAYIFNVTTGALLFTLNNPNAYGTSDNDRFGLSVAISGNYAIVGAQFESDASGTLTGKAYIFNVTTGALLFTLNNPNPDGYGTGDRFGSSVAISGNYAIVGADLEDDAGGSNSGKAYIFNVTTGALLFTLNNPNAYGTSTSDSFGSSVAISDNYAIVGAYDEDDAVGTRSGKVYIFNTTNGTQVHTLDNPNAYSSSFNDQFGSSVAISGNCVIVGAQFESDVNFTLSGKAYIYQLSENHWMTMVGTSAIPTSMAVDSTGNVYTVGYDGNTGILTIKYNSVGGIVWQRKMAGSNMATKTGIAVDSAGNVYVGGMANWAGLIFKYNSLGELQWQRQLDTSSTNAFQASFINDIVVDSSDNVYITGRADTGSAMITAKYDSSGNILWQTKLNSSYGNGIAIDSSGNMHVIGVASGGLLLVKYDSSRNIIWQRQLIHSSGNPSYALDVAVDSSSNVYICGYMPNGNDDMLVAKYDSSGSVLWKRGLASGQSDSAQSISVDSSGNVYVCGFSRYSFSPAVPSCQIIKYNTSGVLQWIRTLRVGIRRTIGAAIALDSLGNMYVCAYTEDATLLTLVAKLPSDGSGAAEFLSGLDSSFTYTVGAETITYNNGAKVTDSEATTITAQTPTLTGSVSTFTSAASSLTDSATTFDVKTARI